MIISHEQRLNRLRPGPPMRPCQNRFVKLGIPDATTKLWTGLNALRRRPASAGAGAPPRRIALPPALRDRTGSGATDDTGPRHGYRRSAPARPPCPAGPPGI